MEEVKFMQLSQDRATIKRSGEFKSQLSTSGRLLSEKLTEAQEIAVSKLCDELMAVEVDESLPSMLVGKLSDHHYDNTGNQYKHDRNADMLDSAASKEPYVCKTVSDLDNCFEELFNYDLEAMKLALDSPSVAVPRGLGREELMAWLNGDWSKVDG